MEQSDHNLLGSKTVLGKQFVKVGSDLINMDYVTQIKMDGNEYKSVCFLSTGIESESRSFQTPTHMKSAKWNGLTIECRDF